MKKAISLVISLILLVVSVRLVIATETPSFPVCSNPQGELLAEYDSGIHAIVGSSTEYRGSDKVYKLDETRTMQCFCSPSGGGIQTNWWKVSSLSLNEIETLKNLGWIFVPNGADWGLDPSPYMAKNNDYSCGSGNTTAASGGGVLSSQTSAPAILGLASTGNMVTLLMYASGAILFGLIGVFFKKNAR
jgi:hypothetical protein